MAALALIVGLVGTGLQVAGAIQQANTAKAVGEYNAKVQEKQGQEQLASSQRSALMEKRKADLLMSRARAVSAASGAGGAETPSVAENIGQIAGWSDYLQRSKLFEGTEMKAGRYEQAALSRAQGQSAYDSGMLSAFGTGLGGLYKYGSSFYG